MEIRNKTKKPLRVPLPGGKRLHLGAGGTGQISPKASDHPPVKALIDDGQIEVVSTGRSQGTGSGGTSGSGGSSQRGPAAGGIRRTGDG